MNTLGMVLGIICLIGMLVAFIPCLGWLNWLNIPLSVIGFVVSLIALLDEKNINKNNAIAGCVMCGVAMGLGGIRLILGGGLL